MATRRKQRLSANIAKAMASVPLAWVPAELRTVHIQAAESGRDEPRPFEAMATACAGRAGARRRARISSGGRPLQESQTRGSGARRLSHCQRAALRVRFCNARRPGLSTLGLAGLCRHRHRASVEGTPIARAFPTPRPRASGRRSASRGEAARRARGPALSCRRQLSSLRTSPITTWRVISASPNVAARRPSRWSASCWATSSGAGQTHANGAHMRAPTGSRPAPVSCPAQARRHHSESVIRDDHAGAHRSKNPSRPSIAHAAAASIVITSLAAPTADRILCTRKVGPSRRRRRSAAAPERPLRAPSAVPRARLTANAERTYAGAAPTLAVPSRRRVPQSSAAAILMVVSPLLGRRSLRTYDLAGAVMPRLRCQRDGK
jgi:hypothetical protein